MIKNKNISIYIYLITLLHIISLLLCCPENCSNCDQDLKCKSCDSNYYLNMTTYECQKCDQSCFICSGPEKTDCKVCYPSYKLSELGQCSSCGPFCPSKCKSNCTICDDDKCYKCTKQSYLFNGVCYPCDNTCNSCINGTSCVDCNPQGVLINTGLCKYPCDKSCLDCFGPNINQCSSCQLNTMIYNNTCYKKGCYNNCIDCSNSLNICLKCALGTYLDTPNCFNCSKNCLSCNGPLENQCLSCFDGSFLNIKDGTCNSCFFNCLSCYGASSGQCSSCKDGFYLVESMCFQCHKDCKTCFGPDEKHCLSCNGTNKIYMNNTNQCIDKDLNQETNSDKSEDNNVLIIVLATIFGGMFVGCVIVLICYIKAKSKIKELKYIQKELVKSVMESQKNSGKMSNRPSISPITPDIEGFLKETTANEKAFLEKSKKIENEYFENNNSKLNSIKKITKSAEKVKIENNVNNIEHFDDGMEKSDKDLEKIYD